MIVPHALAVAGALLVAAFAVPAAADDALTVVSASGPTTFLAVLDEVAAKAGLFKAQHLSVTVEYAGNALLAVGSVNAGKADIAAVSLEPVIESYVKGVRLTAFLALDPHFQHVIGVPADGPVRTLADLAGKLIGESDTGATGELFAKVMLARAGVKPGAYTFVAIGSGNDAIQALRAKKVDAAAFPYPELRTYEAVSDLQFRYFLEPQLSDIPDVAYVASPATIREKADVLSRFCRAIVQAAILVRVNPQLAAKDVADATEQYGPAVAVASEVHLLTSAHDALPADDAASVAIGAIPLRDMQSLTAFMYAHRLTQQLVPAAAIVTGRFIEYANQFDHQDFIKQAQALR
jgi:NitT/TauT family transport system substrate-binding protein